MKQISKQYSFNIQAELKDLNELVTVIKIIRNSIFFYKPRNVFKILLKLPCFKRFKIATECVADLD